MFTALEAYRAPTATDTAEYDTLKRECDLVESELSALSLVGLSLSAGADPRLLLANEELKSGLDALIGADTLTLSLEELQDNLEEKKEEAKKVFWTKRKKVILATAAAVAATMASAIAFSKMKGGHAATSPAPETPKKPAGTSLAVVSGQGRVSHSVAHHTMAKIGDPGDVEVARNPKHTAIYEELDHLDDKAYNLTKRAKFLAKPEDADSHNEDSATFWDKYKNIGRKNVWNAPNEKYIDNTVQNRLKRIEERLSSALKTSGSTEEHPEEQARIASESKKISDEVLALVKRFHS